METAEKQALEQNMEQTIDIKSYNLAELTAWFQAQGEKAFRAKQVYQWMHQKHVTDFEQMTNLPKELRIRLAKQCTLISLKAVERQIAKDGTRKYLFALSDGNMIESVLMRYRHGNSICISSQAGCRMGCTFCASAIGGLVRNLYPSEMLEQIYRIAQDIGERISHVVVMGTGEPLDNFAHLLKFIELLTDDNGIHMSQRNLTVSTCGIVPRIRELADKKLQITLALSLHASSQEKRQALMPVAKKYHLEEVMDACAYYFAQTGRRMTFEYSLIGGMNDTQEDVRRLTQLLKGKNCHLNLIPINPVRERAYVQSNADVINAFKNRLEKNGINVTIRRELGRDIDGACGQLRQKYAQHEPLDCI